MKRPLSILLVSLCCGAAAAADLPELPKCPIMGGAIDFNVAVQTATGPLYFCCKGCIERFEADPASHAKAVTDQQAALAARPRIQVRCPVSGEKVDRAVTMDHDGQKIAFKSKTELAAFQSDPAKYAAALAGSYTYQVQCPVMSEPIDPDVSLTLPTGETVYLCCKRCAKMFTVKAAEYVPNLAKQGVNIDPKKIVPDQGG